MSSIIPPGYRSLLTPWETQEAVWFLRQTFREKLAAALDLAPIAARQLLFPEAGLNDDLHGERRPVSFAIPCVDNRRVEIVHSLSKWKRGELARYDIPVGKGIYAEMNAVRTYETADNVHSVFVDQWDWERRIAEEERTLGFLKRIVRKIYGAVLDAETAVCGRFPRLEPVLPKEIAFLHSEELSARYPEYSPAQRETEAAKTLGAFFLIGIGGILRDGRKHDDRDPDSDDWSTPTGNGFHGLNGDIVLWNPVLRSRFELSSMGIRVDGRGLLRQLDLCGCPHLRELEFHRRLLAGLIPLSIGGGIGISRLCMFLLRKAHIGEVQSSVWPERTLRECGEKGVVLL